MRTIQTFVLTLLIDSEESGVVRGSLHSVADEADYPFADVRSLLELLEQLTLRPMEIRPGADGASINRLRMAPGSAGQEPTSPDPRDD